MPGLKSRIRGLLFDLEAAYGTGAVAALGAADDAILTRGLSPEPLRSNAVEYERDRSALGANSQIIINNQIAFTTDVYVAGNGKSSEDPVVLPYEKLLRVCGFGAGVLEAAPDAWATGTDYTVGQKVTDGGASYICISAHQSQASNKPTATANGGEDYWNSYSRTVTYKPVSDAFASGVFAFNMDGVRFIGNGARGNMTVSFAAGALPFFSFDVQGLPVSSGDSPVPRYDLSDFVVPEGMTKDNTKVCSLHGTDVVVNSWSLDLGNTIFFQDEPNEKAILLNNRNVTGSISLQMTKLAVKDWFELAKSSASGVFQYRHGTAQGKYVEFMGPKVRLGPPAVTDDNDRYILDVPITFEPTDAGNDELSIIAS